MSLFSNSKSPRGPQLLCEEWERQLTDALEGTLTQGDLDLFERHSQSCVACAELYEEARQGTAWLTYLKEEPVASPYLVQKILTRTGGVTLPDLSGVHPVPSGRSRWYQSLVPSTRRAFEPRLVMTAAMAFFSVALTLNVTGFRLSSMQLSDLQPSNLLTSVTRRYYSAAEEVTKYYENLRLVYEMEAHVREMRRSKGEHADDPPNDSHSSTPAPSHDGIAKRSNFSPETPEGTLV